VALAVEISSKNVGYHKRRCGSPLSTAYKTVGCSAEHSAHIPSSPEIRDTDSLQTTNELAVPNP